MGNNNDFLWIKVVVNLAIAAVSWVFLRFGLFLPDIEKLCHPVEISSIFGAVVMVTCLHLAWPILYRHRGVFKKINIPWVEVNVPMFFDLMQKWVFFAEIKTSDLVKFLAFMALLVPAGLLFPTIIEPTPVITSFQITFLGEETSLAAGDTLHATEPVLIRAQLPNDHVVSCAWGARRGETDNAGGCSVYYSPPLNHKEDLLTVTVLSRCQTRESMASLFIVP